MKTGPVTIRPYHPDDEVAVRQLLAGGRSGDQAAWRYHLVKPDTAPEDRRFHRTRVADCSGAIVGVGWLWDNPFHPFALRMGILVDSAWRRRGIGTRLFDELVAENRRGLPLIASTWETSAGGIRFLARLGFREIRRTYEPALPLDGFDSDPYRKFAERCGGAGYRIASLAELAMEQGRNRKVAALCEEIYRATHTVNPPGDTDPAAWEALVFEDLVEEGSFVALHGGEYAAVALLHPGEGSSEMELGWRGVARDHLEHQRNLVLALTFRQLAYAARCGCRTVRAEVDTTDPWSMLLLEHLPFRPAPAWVTLRRN